MKTERRLIYIALLVAFVARLAMYPMSRIDQPAYFEYGDIAAQLVSGGGYSMHHGFIEHPPVLVPSAWMPPGQPFVIAAFFALVGQGALAHHLIFILNALLGTAAVFLLGRTTQALTQDKRCELIALFAAGLYPPFISASATWGVASSVLFLNAFFVFLALRFSQAIFLRQSVGRHAVYLGVAGGVLALFRAEAPLTFGFVLIALLIYHRSELAASLKYVVLSGMVMLAVMSPWMISNYVRFDALILGSTSGGFNLWRGNNAMASGGGWNAEGEGVVPPLDVQQRALQKVEGIEARRFERAYSAALAEEATSWIRSHPIDGALLSIKKLALIWILDLYHPSNLKYVYGICQLTALACAAYGLIALRRRGASTEERRWLWIAGGACLASSVLTMVFFSLPRYQIFLVGLYFPMVAIGMHAILQKWGLLLDGKDPALQGQN